MTDRLGTDNGPWARVLRATPIGPKQEGRPGPAPGRTIGRPEKVKDPEQASLQDREDLPVQDLKELAPREEEDLLPERGTGLREQEWQTVRRLAEAARLLELM